MMKVFISIISLLILPISTLAAGIPSGWQQEIISLISKQKYTEAGESLKYYCTEKKSGELCLILASAYFEGESKFGVDSKDIVEAYKYTKLACDHGSQSGCEASQAAMEKGELITNILLEPGIPDRDSQLKKAIHLGADLNVTTLFTTTILQNAINENKIDAVRLLLANNADVNYRVNDEDLTPLMYAINTGNVEMAKLLLDNGADTQQTMTTPEFLKMDKKEANACDFAQKLKNSEMMSLLKCNSATEPSQ